MVVVKQLPSSRLGAILLTTLLFVFCSELCQGQGLSLAPGRVTAGSSALHRTLSEQYTSSQQFKAIFKANPKAACAAAGTLCSASSSRLDALAQLTLVTSPSAYDARALKVIGSPGDQNDCNTCTAFAVVGGAEAAVASTLGVEGGQIRLSEQDLFYCSSGNDGMQRGCDSSWYFEGALSALTQRPLLTKQCMPYDAYIASSEPGEVCSSRYCSSTDPLTSQGTFRYRQLGAIWIAMSHIRQYGGVVTRLDVMDDFRSFFRNPFNAKAVYKSKPGAMLEVHHAVLVTGYDLAKKYWIIKNSWGSSWADGGFAKVAMGESGLMEPSSTFGITWTPNTPQLLKPLIVSAVPGEPGCYHYKAGPGDYISRVALLAGIPLPRFMLENTQAGLITDLDAPLAGKQLLLCNPKQGAVRMINSTAAPHKLTQLLPPSPSPASGLKPKQSPSSPLPTTSPTSNSGSKKPGSSNTTSNSSSYSSNPNAAGSQKSNPRPSSPSPYSVGSSSPNFGLAAGSPRPLSGSSSSSPTPSSPRPYSGSSSSSPRPYSSSNSSSSSSSPIRSSPRPYSSSSSSSPIPSSPRPYSGSSSSSPRPYSSSSSSSPIPSSPRPYSGSSSSSPRPYSSSSSPIPSSPHPLSGSSSPIPSSPRPHSGSSKAQQQH